MKTLNLATALALVSLNALSLAPASAKDISIKELNHANAGVTFNRIMPAASPPNEHVYYDVDYRKQGCAITCDQTDGLLVKWSSFFLQIQPYERYCPFIWCRSRYPAPPNEITIITNSSSYVVKGLGKGDHTYYLPLQARVAISKSSALEVSVPGVGLSSYKPSASTLEDIREVVNASVELPGYTAIQEEGVRSIEDRLVEAESLRKSGLISEEELKKMRNKILGISD